MSKPIKPAWHPSYWLTWLGMSLWWCIAQLPYSVQLQLAKPLTGLLKIAGKRRLKIIRRNLELCFPEKTAAEREAIFQENLYASAMAFFETGISWFWSPKRLRKLYTIEGIEHLHALDGQGALLTAMHFTTLDIGASLMGLEWPIDGMYRPHNNPAYDWFQRRGRNRLNEGSTLYSRDDARGVLRALKKGRVIWYAPDQDYGMKNNRSVFAPFFGIQAASVIATSKFAKVGKAAVVPFTQTRKADGTGYHLTLYPALENYPSGDDVADCTTINQLAERLIREKPEQYLWAHRRFKSRPESEASLYL